MISMEIRKQKTETERKTEWRIDVKLRPLNPGTGKFIKITYLI